MIGIPPSDLESPLSAVIKEKYRYFLSSSTLLGDAWWQTVITNKATKIR